ncbi:LOW QUALITY PROTEIN: uncharacterized protein LOC143220133 [Lasioglossum baleicum]|uniref:LOW QUALITY PROTEIN: uncharacterized protein LOC143220133 n=1 Tax=Lasioglossum baleicum TaxID=434251 RepID=UPI003FCE83AB
MSAIFKAVKKTHNTSHANALLQRINDIDGECSEGDQEIQDMENDNAENYDPFETDSTTDEDEWNISNVRRRRKRKRFLVSSDSENEKEASENAMAGAVCQEVKIGRAPGHIFRETSGPTGYSKRNTMKGEVWTTCSVIIDKNIIDHIRKCTEAEAFIVLGYKWEQSTAKLYALFAIMYARGAYEAEDIFIALLWNRKWGAPSLSNTMNRHDFTEIMRFIRLHDRNHRNQRLQTDKFAMISEAWCRFTLYMLNKQELPVYLDHKFGLKFWLASDVRSKHIINGFPYLGKDESREPSVLLGEVVTMKLAEPASSTLHPWAREWDTPNEGSAWRNLPHTYQLARVPPNPRYGPTTDPSRPIQASGDGGRTEARPPQGSKRFPMYQCMQGRTGHTPHKDTLHPE